MNFESHITIDTSDLTNPKEQIEELKAIAKELKWTTSNITDDPILGPGNKFYFTMHCDNYDDSMDELNIAWETLCDRGFIPVRRKIELVMYDYVAHKKKVKYFNE